MTLPFFATFIASEIACADSNAGIIPSVLVRVKNASKTSLSVDEWYFTRLVSL